MRFDLIVQLYMDMYLLPVLGVFSRRKKETGNKKDNVQVHALNGFLGRAGVRGGGQVCKRTLLFGGNDVTYLV